MLYETTILLSPQLSTDELYSLWEKIAQEIKHLGATVEREIKPFERNLAYPIKKGAGFRRAYLGVLYLSPEKARKELSSALRELLKSKNDVIRFMVSCVTSVPERKQRSLPRSVVQETNSKRAANEFVSRGSETETKTPSTSDTQELKEEKPSLEDLDKKLEEILEDKINF